jgi:nucleotidyltransferase substrate binding protein (TIGR01987 family)
LIQAFEFAHELAWNTLKDFLESRDKLNIFGSKDATREAFAAGLIDNGDAWLQMIESRNATTHTCDEKTADAIAQAILSRYVPPSLESSKADSYNWGAREKHETRPEQRHGRSNSLGPRPF